MKPRGFLPLSYSLEVMKVKKKRSDHKRAGLSALKRGDSKSAAKHFDAVTRKSKKKVEFTTKKGEKVSFWAFKVPKKRSKGRGKRVK